MLEKLPSAEYDRARADRVRARCRAVLERSRRPPRRSRVQRVAETALAGLGAIYLVEGIRLALLMFGIA
jgi:hypothetical protein